MGKTIRNERFSGKVFKRPKGKKQALIHKIRYKAIPPDSWDEIPASNERRITYNIVERMRKKGVKSELVIEKMIKNYGFSPVGASQFVRHIYFPKNDCIGNWMKF